YACRSAQLTPAAGVRQSDLMQPAGEREKSTPLNAHRLSRDVHGLRFVAVLCTFIFGFVACLPAEDWPQWRGPRRDGTWLESGILTNFPSQGLKVLWRVPVGSGFSSPVIARGKVYVTDSLVTRTNVHEFVHCLDAATGRTIWIHKYRVVYPEYGSNPDHPFGPVATPVVANGKVYTFGRMSHLLCLDALTGNVLWSHDLPKEFNTTEDLRGFNSSPLIESNLVIIA